MVADNKGANKNRRVTSTELYQSIIKQNKDRVEMERRLSGKLSDLNTAVTQIAKQPEVCQSYFVHINERIDKNEKAIEKSRLWEKLLALFTVIAGALGIAIER